MKAPLRVQGVSPPPSDPWVGRNRRLLPIDEHPTVTMSMTEDKTTNPSIILRIIQRPAGDISWSACADPAGGMGRRSRIRELVGLQWAHFGGWDARARR